MAITTKKKTAAPAKTAAKPAASKKPAAKVEETPVKKVAKGKPTEAPKVEVTKVVAKAPAKKVEKPSKKEDTKPAKKQKAEEVAEEEVTHKVCNICEKKRKVKEFPRRSDRKGGTALHSYCRECKSKYETEKRAVGAVRSLAAEQHDTLPKKGEVEVYRDGSEKLTVDPKSRVARFEDEENVYELTFTDEGRRLLIIALGGVAV